MPEPDTRPSPPATESTATQTSLSGGPSATSAAAGATRATSINNLEEAERHLLEKRQQRRMSGRSLSSSSYSSTYSTSGSFSRRSSDITSSIASSAKERSQVSALDRVSSVTSSGSDRNSNLVARAVDGPPHLGEGSDSADIAPNMLIAVNVCNSCGDPAEGSVKQGNMASSHIGDEKGPDGELVRKRSQEALHQEYPVQPNPPETTHVEVRFEKLQRR